MVDRNAEAIAEQLLGWSTPERARLASLLLASLEPVEAGVEVAWESEIQRRMTELQTNSSQPISAADVFAELDRRLSEH